MGRAPLAAMPEGEDATGLPEMTENSLRDVRCDENRMISPIFYPQL
jgi:hypothetical protein